MQRTNETTNIRRTVGGALLLTVDVLNIKRFFNMEMTAREGDRGSFDLDKRNEDESNMPRHLYTEYRGRISTLINFQLSFLFMYVFQLRLINVLKTPKRKRAPYMGVVSSSCGCAAVALRNLVIFNSTLFALQFQPFFCCWFCFSN